MSAEPLPVGEGFGGAHAIAAADSNHDGVEDLIVSDRNGFLFLFEQVMTDKGPRFVRRETVCGAAGGLPMNLEFLHPVLGRIDLIDGDGGLEAVYGGNETGISYYCKLVRREIG